jgi:hypothetical protein
MQTYHEQILAHPKVDASQIKLYLESLETRRKKLWQMTEVIQLPLERSKFYKEIERCESIIKREQQQQPSDPTLHQSFI